MRDDLRSLFAYNRWANDLVVESVRRLAPHQYIGEPAPGWTSIRATLVHLADATWIWARRLQGEAVAARMTEAEVPELDDVVRLLDRGHDAFDRLVATLTPEQLGASWSYRNIEGKEFRVPLWAVYRHVVNHATYHRGQVASKLKRFAVDAPATDFVFWAIAQTPQP
jgi:uncharacterized damage-inducible protein DinB